MDVEFTAERYGIIMKIIAAIDRKWGIGKDNSLLISIPEDMKFFRAATDGCAVIMGRKTLESFPGSKPLKNRVNIVLTRNSDYIKDGAIIVRNVNELIKTLNGIDVSDVFVIGGGSVYEQLLPMCETAYITKIDAEFEADTFFPNLDIDSSWKLSKAGELKDYNGINYLFTTYVRI